MDWLLAQLTELRPDVLIVAGDIFDGATPPQESLKLYYEFLSRLARSVKCQILILGGNHDSAATLHAPREILRALDIRVIASPPEDPDEALLELEHAIVCAVPFLRERDVRLAEAGQSADEVAAAIRAGVVAHYRAIHGRASARAGGRLLIATGHLTAIGAQVSPSERAIHIGNLGAVAATCFDGFAYTALGHIHRAQTVGGDERVRYVGSPIPLSFSEVDLGKAIRVIDVVGATLTQREITVPVFRPLLRLTTTVAALKDDLARHQSAAGDAFLPWIELTVTDGRVHPDLDRQVREVTTDLRLRVLKLLTPVAALDGASAGSDAVVRSLAELRPEDVFAERLRRESIDPLSEEGRALVLTFAELMSRLQETDTAAPPAASA